MKSSFNPFLPPVFQFDDEKTRRAQTLYLILMISWSLPLIALFSVLANPENAAITPVVIVFAVAILSLQVLNGLGYVSIAGTIYTLFLIAIFTYLDVLTGSEHPRPALILLSSLAILVSGLLISGRAPFFVAVALVILRIMLTFFGVIGVTHGTLPAASPRQEVVAISLGYILVAVLFRQATSGIQLALQRLRESQKALESSNQDLSELTRTLELRVAERTAELAAANTKNERRAAQFEAIAQVSRTISSTQDLNLLLTQITSVINRLFGFYHVGIFLMDEKEEFAVLSASNSEGGQRMLERNHRLKVGEVGIVGYVTSTGIPRVALDTGQDAVFFNNPDLPFTRSEIALPFQVGGRIIGALDVQSKEANAFAEEDVSILSILAEQVAIAIQNARQFEETRKALAESDTLSRQFVRQGWREFTKVRNLRGIRHSGAKATLLYAENGSSGLEKFSMEEQATDPKNGSIALPVRIRGEVIGIVHIQSAGDVSLDQDDIDIVQAILERAAVALENARLLTDSQKRAAKERAIGEISSKLSAQSDIDELLKTAAQELGRALPKASIAIQFKTE